jgi:hypothetical protein
MASGADAIVCSVQTSKKFHFAVLVWSDIADLVFHHDVDAVWHRHIVSL